MFHPRTRASFHPTRLATVVTAAALLLGACGGDDMSNAPVAVGDSVSSAEISDIADAMGDVEAMAAASGVPEYCLEISIAMMSAMGAVGGAMTDSQTLANIPAAFEAIRGQAPEELRSDIDIVRDGYASYLSILAEYDYDFVKVSSDAAAIEKMSQIMDSAEFNESSERFNAWIDSVCAE